MVPILGMKFEDHEQMKIMLANYAVANGYQLWYKRNDYKSLLALCGRNVSEGRCASKVDRRKSVALQMVVTSLLRKLQKGVLKRKLQKGVLKRKLKRAQIKGKKEKQLYLLMYASLGYGVHG